MTNEEREHIREVARRYVHEQAPVPPVAVLERVARIILQSKTPPHPSAVPDRAVSTSHQPEAAA